MKGHALVEIILRGLHDLQISTLELVVEGHSGNLTGNDRHTAGLLRLILVVVHFGHGVNAGHQVVDLNFSLGVGLDCLIDAVACDGKGEVIHLAVLRGLDDLSRAVGHLQIEERLHRVHNSGCVSDRILHGSVRPIVTVAPYDNALTDIVLAGGDGHRFCRCSLSGNGQCVAIARKDNIGQVAAEGIVRYHMIAVGQGSCVLITVPFQLDRLPCCGQPDREPLLFGGHFPIRLPGTLRHGYPFAILCFGDDQPPFSFLPEPFPLHWGRCYCPKKK